MDTALALPETLAEAHASMGELLAVVQALRVENAPLFRSIANHTIRTWGMQR